MGLSGTFEIIWSNSFIPHKNRWGRWNPERWNWNLKLMSLSVKEPEVNPCSPDSQPRLLIWAFAASVGKNNPNQIKLILTFFFCVCYIQSPSFFLKSYCFNFRYFYYISLLFVKNDFIYANIWIRWCGNTSLKEIQIYE